MPNPTKAEIEAALAEGARRRRETIRASKPWLNPEPPKPPAKVRRVRVVKGEPVKARDTHRELPKVKELTERKVKGKRVHTPTEKIVQEAPSPPAVPKVPAQYGGASGNGSLARHAWLERANTWCIYYLRGLGCIVPDKVRVTIGFPWKSRKAIGQCWQPTCSTDDHGEILISPVMDDGAKILATLIHELIHAATPGAKHGASFKAHAVKAGLTGKMTATLAGPELATILAGYVTEAGAYPAGAITVAGLAARPKQTTRYKKAKCETCGYTCRVSRQWVNQVGPPHCPVHGAMSVELGDGEGD